MRKIILALLLLLGCAVSRAQIGIGVANPAASAVFEVASTTKGLLPPRLTTAQRDAIVSPVAGLIIYNTTKNCMEWYTSSLWFNGCGANGSSNGTAIVSGFTCTTGSTGTMTAGTAVSGVTQTITASVTTVGTYFISAVANGVSFSSSGTFAGTGSQDVVLTATGTPAAAGSYSFAFNTPAPATCSFPRTILSPGSGGTAIVSSYNCTGAFAGSMTAGTPVSGVSQTITANVTTAGTYSISAVANGVTFSGSGTFAGAGSPTVVLTASGTPLVVGTNSFALNTTPGCSFNGTTYASPPLPGNIVLSSISPYFVASVYDNNYTPYATPTGPANLTTGTNPDGTAETLVDIQGVITTTGVTVAIPYTVTTSPVTLPAFTQTVTIPSGSAQDGISRDLTFSYPGATLAVGTGTITATLKALGGTLNAKKLDVQTGIGNDNLGYLLGQFTYATNNSGGTANFAVRDIAGIPDRNIADADHKMLYVPIVSATGRTWLNNNLGADYSNISKASFNPAQQGTSATDYKAYGSFFQWGRYSDGHELINWTSGTGGGGTAVNGSTSTSSTTDTPGNALFIKIADWRNSQNDALWQGVAGINNPCPVGFRLPTDAELTAEATQYSITNPATGYSSIHKFVLPGDRAYSDAVVYYVGSGAYYWSSTVGGSNAYLRRFDTGLSDSILSVRGYGFSVRCIKD